MGRWVKKANIKGEPGKGGAPGPAGPSNKLRIGTVTTVVDTAEASASITGSMPDQVINLKIPRGIPAPGVAPTDSVIGALMRTSGTESEQAVAGAVVAAVALDRSSEGQGLSKAALGGTKTITLTGHSLMYGQDTTATGTLPPVNGATQSRSATPTTVAFAAQAALVSPGVVTVVNQGYPGDRTSDSLNRWAGGTSGDLEIFWLDTNDANDYGGRGGTLTDAQTLANFRAMVLRANARGAEVVVAGGAPVSDLTNSRKVYASAASDRSIAQRYGATFVDLGEMLSALPVSQDYFTDGVHMRPQPYSLVGSRLAALTGPKGATPPRVSPGRKISPRDNLHVGGTLTTQSQSTTGKTIRLVAGDTFALPVDVTAPTLPLIRFFRGGTATTVLGAGDVKLSYNLGTSGVPDTTVVLTPGTGTSNNALHYTWVPYPALVSPGPDAITLTCTSGSVEIDMVLFDGVPAPVQSKASAFPEPNQTRKELRLSPVGGVAGRADASWDHVMDLASGTSLFAPDGTNPSSVKWLFDLTLGRSFSGILLAEGLSSATGYGIQHGYMILRNAHILKLRTWATSAAMVDLDIPSVFPDTGYVHAILEVHFNPATSALDVYVDGALKGSIASPTYRYLTAGILAGVSAGGAGYAAGTGIVYA